MSLFSGLLDWRRATVRSVDPRDRDLLDACRGVPEVGRQNWPSWWAGRAQQLVGLGVLREVPAIGGAIGRGGYVLTGKGRQALAKLPSTGIQRRQVLGLIAVGAAVSLLPNDAEAAARRVRGYRETITDSVTVTKGASGIAPLLTNFDARATTSPRTSRPFHAIRYYWDFGDGSAPTWTTGAHLGSSNNAIGPVVAHVYATAGTYTPTCLMNDGSSLKLWTGSAITVASNVAPAAWATTKTILVSSSGSFTCAGVTGATTINTGSADDAYDQGVTAFLAASAATGSARLLFRKGETFKASAGALAAYLRSTGGPVWVGTYDDNGPSLGGTKATIAALSTPGGAGYATGVMNIGFVSPGLQTMADWRITDLALDVSAVLPTTTSYCITQQGAWKDILFYNLDLIGASWVAVNMSPSILLSPFKLSRGFAMPSNVGLVNCTQSGSRVTASLVLNSFAYLGAHLLTVMGCTLNARGDAQSSSHNLRIIQTSGAYISHNDFVYPGSNKHSIKVHSDGVLPRQLNTAYLSTSNGGNGDFRRPLNPVALGLIAPDVRPPIYRCTTSGTSHASTEPTWGTTAGSTTTDGTAVWTECSAAFYAGTMLPNDSVSLRTDGVGTEKYWTDAVIIHDNKFTNGTAIQTIAIGSQDGTVDGYELIYDAIVDGNWFPVWATGGTITTTACEHTSRGLTFRNNLLNPSGATSLVMVGGTLRGYTTPGTETSTYASWDLQVYNNSIALTSTASSSATFVSADIFTRNTVVKNNVLYNTSGKTITMTTGGHSSYPLVAANNSGNVATVTTDPKFSGSLSTVAGWQITDPTSYTKGAGANVPVWADFYGTGRATGSMDMGASQR